MILKCICFILMSLLTGVINAASGRAKNTNSLKLTGLFGVLADLSWIILFSGFINGNVLDIPTVLFIPLYVSGYSSGRLLTIFMFIKFEKGNASIGGIDLLKDRVSILEKQSKKDRS